MFCPPRHDSETFVRETRGTFVIRYHSSQTDMGVKYHTDWQFDVYLRTSTGHQLFLAKVQPVQVPPYDSMLLPVRAAVNTNNNTSTTRDQNMLR